MLIQKGTTGHVDSRRAAIDTAIGAVPLGGTARVIGAGVREVVRAFKPPEMFYRAMSFAERDGVLVSRQISVRGESFVTQDIAYSRSPARGAASGEVRDAPPVDDATRHPRRALVAAGAPQPGNDSWTAPGLEPSATDPKGQPDVVHIKGEGGSITFGLSAGFHYIFNDRIVGIEVIE